MLPFSDFLHCIVLLITFIQLLNLNNKSVHILWLEVDGPENRYSTMYDKEETETLES